MQMKNINDKVERELKWFITNNIENKTLLGCFIATLKHCPNEFVLQRLSAEGISQMTKSSSGGLCD